MNRELLHHVVDTRKLGAPRRGILVEAHADDRTMARVTAALAQQDIALTIVTLTDGSARNVPQYTPEQLTNVRWDESKAHAEIVNAAQVFQSDIPDGQLPRYLSDAKSILQGIMDTVKPDFVIAPHPEDQHQDHAAAYEVARAVVGDIIPLYATDTISGRDRMGRVVVPTHYIVLPRRTAQRENRGYLANMSQVSGIPPHEIRDVHAVLGMTRRRGKEMGIAHAAALIHTANTDRDPISSLFGRRVRRV